MKLFLSFIIVFFISLNLAYGDNFYAQGPRGKKQIAITFDDGPGPHTQEVLDMLKANGVKATFFMEGQLINIRPAIASMVIADGHEVGSHLYDHPNFYRMKGIENKPKLLKQIQLSENAFMKIGHKPNLVRMPYGFVNTWVKETLAEKGYTDINWSFGCDWSKMKKEELAAAYIRNVKAGAILLFHDGGSNRERTIYAAQMAIAEAKRQGLELVTISQLLGIKATKLNN